MLHRSCNVRETVMTSCDDVIDDVIMQIMTLKFFDFHPQNWKIQRKLFANNNLRFKKAIRVVYDPFSITSS